MLLPTGPAQQPFRIWGRPAAEELGPGLSPSALESVFPLGRERTMWTTRTPAQGLGHWSHTFLPPGQAGGLVTSAHREDGRGAEEPPQGPLKKNLHSQVL
jgi:hypothetical protein